MNSLAKSESNSPAMSIKNAKITNNSRYQTTFIKADVLKQTNQKGKKKKPTLLRRPLKYTLESAFCHCEKIPKLVSL
jgi:hypothetical protein